MGWKRLLVQAFAAFLLYVGISLILEQEFNNEILIREVKEGIVFGIIYAIFIWVRDKYFRRKE